MPTIDKNLIIFDYRDWLAGMHQQSGEGTTILFNGHTVASNINPFRRLGYISAGTKADPVANSSEVDGAIKRIVANTPYANNLSNTVWSWGAGGTKIYKIAALDGDIQSSPHAISGATMEDIVLYNIGGNESLYVSYNTSGGGDIAVYDNFNTWDDDYLTTILSGTLNKDVPHPMIVGDDDILYIGDKNVLKYIDASGPTLGTSLTLPSSYTIKGFSKYSNSSLVIFADQDTGKVTGSARAFFWDYVSEDPYKICDIQGNTLGGAVNYKGSVGIFSNGMSSDEEEDNRDFRFNWFNGSEFEVIYNIEARPNNFSNIPSFGGASVLGDYLLVNVNGTIWSFGSPFKGVSAGVTPVYRGGGSSSGALFRTEQEILLCSSGTSTSGGLDNLSTGYDSAELQTSFSDVLSGISKTNKIKRVRVDFENTVTSGSQKLSMFFRDETDSSEIQIYDNLDEIKSGNLSQVIYPEAFVSEGFGTFNCLSLILDWGSSTASSSPVVKRVIVEFEKVEIN